MHGLGDEYPTLRGLSFQSGGNVDTLAENVLAFYDDVTEIDPDSELDWCARRQFCIVIRHRALEGDAALHRIDRAREFD
jgi:hypothetical protein